MLRKLYYTDWLDRLDLLMCMGVGRRAASFEGIDWHRLYVAGCSPGEVFEAFYEEWSAVSREDEMQEVAT
jgi:hypothetical protein